MTPNDKRDHFNCLSKAKLFLSNVLRPIKKSKFAKMIKIHMSIALNLWFMNDDILGICWKKNWKKSISVFFVLVMTVVNIFAKCVDSKQIFSFIKYKQNTDDHWLSQWIRTAHKTINKQTKHTYIHRVWLNGDDISSF